MTLKVRKLKKYYPRRSATIMRPLRENLHNLEIKIQADLVLFLAAIQKGSKEDLAVTSEKIKHNLAKFGPEMQKIADEIGATFPKRVSTFLSSIEQVLQTQSAHTMDPTKIAYCNLATKKLEELLIK